MNATGYLAPLKSKTSTSSQNSARQLPAAMHTERCCTYRASNCPCGVETTPAMPQHSVSRVAVAATMDAPPTRVSAAQRSLLWCWLLVLGNPSCSGPCSQRDDTVAAVAATSIVLVLFEQLVLVLLVVEEGHILWLVLQKDDARSLAVVIVVVMVLREVVCCKTQPVSGVNGQPANSPTYVELLPHYSAIIEDPPSS